MQDVLNALNTLRAPAVADEAELSRLVAGCLAQNGIEYEKERRLGRGCRADFMAGGLLIEVKANMSGSAAIVRQLSRYAEFDDVREILLVANDAVRLPNVIRGKPARALSLKRLWGVAL